MMGGSCVEGRISRSMFQMFSYTALSLGQITSNDVIVWENTGAGKLNLLGGIDNNFIVR